MQKGGYLVKKLFEFLAVEKDLSTKATNTVKEVSKLFEKVDNFLGMNTSYEALVEGKPVLPDEKHELAHVVEDSLQEIQEAVGAYVDAAVQKEMANTNAFADVIVDGTKFFEHMSATALLNLEARLEELHKLYSTIPVLPQGQAWKQDANLGHFVSEERKQLRTEKVNEVIVLYDATPEHPAQTQLVSVDKPAYEIRRTIYAGAMTLPEKKERIVRIEKLQQAVKQARQRANTVEVEAAESYATKLFGFIDGK